MEKAISIEKVVIGNAERVEASSVAFSLLNKTASSSTSSSTQLTPVSSTPAQDSSRSTYAVYLLRVLCRVGRSTLIETATFRRYSEFRTLDSEVSSRFKNLPQPLPPLPPRRPLGNLRESFLAVRRQQLQVYINALLEEGPAVTSSRIVVQFFCPVLERTTFATSASVSFLEDSIGFLLATSAVKNQRKSPQVDLSLSADNIPTPHIPHPRSLSDLPDTVLLAIFARLSSFRDLLALARASRRFYLLAGSNSLWGPLLARCYPTWSDVVVDPPTMSSLAVSVAKKQFLRLYSRCTPTRRTFKAADTFLRCTCHLLKLLAVSVGDYRAVSAFQDCLYAAASDKDDSVIAACKDNVQPTTTVPQHVFDSPKSTLLSEEHDSGSFVGFILRQKARPPSLNLSLDSSHGQDASSDSSAAPKPASTTSEHKDEIDEVQYPVPKKLDKDSASRRPEPSTNELRYFMSAHVARVHVEDRTCSYCFHVHSSLSSQLSVRPCNIPGAASSNDAKLTMHFLLRSNCCLAVFRIDEPVTLSALRPLVLNVHELCPSLPIFLVGFPSPRPKTHDTVCVTRLQGVEAAIMFGAVKYIELTELSPQAVRALLAEVSAVLHKTLNVTPAKEVDPRTEFGRSQELVLEAMQTRNDDNKKLGPARGPGSEENEGVPGAAASPSHLASSSLPGMLLKPAETLEERGEMQLTQAILRGSRQFFLAQLQAYSIDGVIQEFISSTMPLQDRSQAIKEFVSCMIDYVQRTVLWKDSTKREKLLVAHEIEEYVFEKLYYTLFRPPEDMQEDEMIRNKISKLSFVLPSHLEIPRQFWDTDAWNTAAEELLNMNFCTSPFGKKECLLSCAKVILHSMQVRSSRGDTGADHFLPHLVYVLLKANPPFLASNLSFVKRFSSDSDRTSEASYYWLSLEVAIKFILDIKAKQLHLSESEFQRLCGDTVRHESLSLEQVSAVPEKPSKFLGLKCFSASDSYTLFTRKAGPKGHNYRMVPSPASTSATTSSATPFYNSIKSIPVVDGPSPDDDNEEMARLIRGRANTRRIVYSQPNGGDREPESLVAIFAPRDEDDSVASDADTSSMDKHLLRSKTPKS